MKDLLSKEHYCYKIHTLLMKSSTYLLFYRHSNTLHPYMGYLPFLPENLDPTFYDFLKIPSPPISKGEDGEVTLRILHVIS